MSFGIASSAIEEAFDFDAVFACADAALHAAKRAGRDRVHVAGAADPGYGPERTAQTAAGEGATKSERAGGDSGVDGRANPAPPARGERSEVAARGVASSFAERARVVSADLERDYVIDLNERLATLFRVIAVGVFVVIATQIGEFGWHVLIPPILGAVPYYLLSHNAHRFRRPSVAIAGSWALLQSSIAAGFLLSRGAPLFALPLLVLIVPGRCAVLRTRAAAAGTAYTAVLMIAVAFAMDSSRVLGDPAVVLFGLALLAEAAFAGAVVGGSAVGFRGASTVDSLTGLLNRHALGARLAELDAAAHDRPRSVAIVVGDLDQFRAVNDSVGHAAGDAALRGVAERITASLRTFQRAYRVGGEEFLVLLPDTDVETAGRVAERLRHVVGARPCGGQIVTMSFGVAANAPGTRFDHRDVLARADAALYDAKHLGRDTVVVDRPPERAVTVGAAVAQA
jgi:diguanylate cyclase (GGDEF)-like protein